MPCCNIQTRSFHAFKHMLQMLQMLHMLHMLAAQGTWLGPSSALGESTCSSWMFDPLCAEMRWASLLKHKSYIIRLLLKCCNQGTGAKWQAMDELLDAEALSASSERVGIRTLVHVHLTQELLRMPPSVGSKAVTKKRTCPHLGHQNISFLH